MVRLVLVFLTLLAPIVGCQTSSGEAQSGVLTLRETALEVAAKVTTDIKPIVAAYADQSSNHIYNQLWPWMVGLGVAFAGLVGVVALLGWVLRRAIEELGEDQ